jgi:cytochrome c oxidase subunit 4
MPEHRTIAPATYVRVCVVLVALTVVTVGFSFARVPGEWHIAFGLTIGLLKASLVVLFFMHALLSTRVTWAVIAVSGFWLSILLVLTLVDYFTRGMGPDLAGH